MREKVLEKIKRYRLIAIVRNVQAEDLLPLIDALYQGGIRLVEIPFDASAKAEGIRRTAEGIRAIRERFGGDFSIGAGTVLSCEQADAAKDAGAEFLISPNTEETVIRYTRQCGLVSIPGAMTPTEVVRAWEYGADIVKLFPVDSLGAAYIRALRAPLNHIPMLAVGGVDESNVAELLAAGLCGAGVGGNLVSKTAIAARQFDVIRCTAELYVQKINGILNKEV